MDLKRFYKFVNNNLVLIVGIPMIISVHWGWNKLQEVPYLVPESDRKGIPIVEAVKVFKKYWQTNITEAESSTSK